MARKSKSSRPSLNSETRSNTSGRSGRSRRSTRSKKSRASADRSSQGHGKPAPLEMEEDTSREQDLSVPSMKWQSPICCAGGTCCYGFCVPCAIATARHRLDESSWCLNFWCLSICAARNIFRTSYGIKGHCCADIACSTMCAPCVACQLLSEADKRGSVDDTWAAQLTRPRYEQPWKFGLIKCMDDPTNCAYGCFCPCLATASARTQMDESDWLFNCCFVNAFITRSLVRQGYHIEGSDTEDFCITCFCFPCSVCQLLNETQHRGRLGAAPLRNTMSR